MKIGPTPPQSPPHLARLPDQSPTRADGFDALGMFGLSRSHEEPGSARRGAAQAPIARVARAEERDAMPGTKAETPLPNPLRCATPAPPKQGPVSPLEPPTFPQETGSGGGLGDLVGPAVVGAPEGEAGSDDEAPAPASPARSRPAAKASAVSLMLREVNGAAEVIAAAPAADPDARQSLRRLVGEILARSGLTLVQFHLNGAPLAPDFLGKTGGSHGSRAR